MLLVITGRAGAGTTTLAQALLRYRSDARMLTSITTRRQRPDDLPGEYEAVSMERFMDMENQRVFLWQVALWGHRYGTSEESFKRAIERDGLYIACISTPKVLEVLVHAQAYGKHSNVHPLFLRCDGSELLRRLYGKGYTPEEAEKRLAATADWEDLAHQFRVFHFLDANQSAASVLSAASATFAKPTVVY